MLSGARTHLSLLTSRSFSSQKHEFQVSASKWAFATNLYNEKLEILTKSKNETFVRKNPRALEDKLTAIEAAVLQRVRKGYYKSEH